MTIQGRKLGKSIKQMRKAIDWAQRGYDVAFIVGSQRHQEWAMDLLIRVIDEMPPRTWCYGAAIGSGKITFMSALDGPDQLIGWRGPVLAHKHAFSSVIAKRQERDLGDLMDGCNAAYAPAEQS